MARFKGMKFLKHISGGWKACPASEASALGTRYAPPSGDFVGLAFGNRTIGGSHPTKRALDLSLNFGRKKSLRSTASFWCDGALGRIRTSDRLVRSQVLYPAELRARNLVKSVPLIFQSG